MIFSLRQRTEWSVERREGENLTSDARFVFLTLNIELSIFAVLIQNNSRSIDSVSRNWTWNNIVVLEEAEVYHEYLNPSDQMCRTTSGNRPSQRSISHLPRRKKVEAVLPEVITKAWFRSSIGWDRCAFTDSLVLKDSAGSPSISARYFNDVWVSVDFHAIISSENLMRRFLSMWTLRGREGHRWLACASVAIASLRRQPLAIVSEDTSQMNLMSQWKSSFGRRPTRRHWNKMKDYHRFLLEDLSPMGDKLFFSPQSHSHWERSEVRARTLLK